MNWADYVILGVLTISVFIGVFRGFIKEVLALAIWVVALWVAWQFAGDAAVWLEPHVELPSARVAIAFVGLLLLVLALGGLMNWLLSLLVESTGLSGTDRLLGLFFGAARGVVLLCGVVLVAGLTPLPQDPWWQQSLLIPRLEDVAQWAVEAMPPEVAEAFDFGDRFEVLDFLEEDPPPPADSP